MGEMLPARLASVPWVNLFQALFGANSADWAKTLATWSLLFDAEGRSNSELVSAVQAISRHSPIPQWPTQFLDALRSELRQQDLSMRQATEARRLEDSERPPRCQTCSDFGWICGLPHLETVRGPEWLEPRWTCAVTCQCEAGCRVFAAWGQRQPEPKPVMSIYTYTQKNPHYQVQMELRALEVTAKVQTYEQEKGPAEWRATVEGILKRYGNQAK
jgi:hypothetical protein